MPSAAAWPAATGASRRTGTTTTVSARPEDVSLQQPVMKQQPEENRSGARRPEREGGRDDRPEAEARGGAVVGERLVGGNRAAKRLVEDHGIN